MSVELARRPSYGSLGRPLDVLVNVFPVTSFPKDNFFHYDVVFEPPVKVPRGREALMYKLRTRTHPEIFSSLLSLYDGRHNLFVYKNQPFPASRTFIVPKGREISNGPPARTVSITIKLVGRITSNDLDKVLKGQYEGVPMSTTVMQVFNVLVQQAAAIKFPVHTKHRYFINEDYDVFMGFEIWRGFYHSARPSVGRLLVNVDMATGVMYQRGNLIDFVLKYFGIRDVRVLADLPETALQFSRMANVLKGLKVRQTNSNAYRTIKSVVARGGRFEFTLHTNGEAITVENYFRNKSVRLAYPLLPAICDFGGNIVPFELCEIIEGQFFRKKTSPELTEKMLNFAKKRPQDRLNIIMKGLEKLSLHDSPDMMQAGMNIGHQPMRIRARQLQPPNLLYKGMTQSSPRDGAWNMLGKQFAIAEEITKWAVLCMDQGILLQQIQGFIEKLVKAMKEVGMSVRQPYPQIIAGSGTSASVLDDLRQARAAANKGVPPAWEKEPPTIILIILPEHAADLRRLIKRFGDAEHGLCTQCIRSPKMLRANNQYHNNLILKINAKCGGTNAVPSGPGFDWFKKGDTIVLGADVTHPSPGVMRPSVAALVSSVDENAARYIASITPQAPRLEIIEGLPQMIKNAVTMFHGYRTFVNKQNRTGLPSVPERFIFFRDGVSESEIQSVADNEVRVLEEAIRELYKQREVDIKPKITFIVVGKRHHIRFFPVDPKTGDKSGNCPPGLVVDEEITSPGLFDFYLQSHAGILGTSRPGHYIVVRDDNNFGPDMIQSFAFSLTHAYARSTRSVSIPAPVYYADIVCSRADFHFDSDLHYSDDMSFSGGANFDMQDWISGFKPVHSSQSHRMYFV